MKTFYVQTSSPPYPYKGRRYNSMGTKMPKVDYLSPDLVDLRKVVADNGEQAIRKVKAGQGQVIIG